MTDVVDPATRRRMMAGIKRQDTQPELALRRCLHALGLRYRLHARHLPGTPDLTFPQHGCAVFVHGCFWHRHDCRHAKIPATHRAFWLRKLETNRVRDQVVLKQLMAAGWRCAVVWECALRGAASAEKAFTVANQLKKWLHNGKTDMLEIHGEAKRP